MNDAARLFLRAHPELSDAEARAALAADPRTQQNLDRKALNAHLLKTGLLMRFRQALADPKLPPQVAVPLSVINDIFLSGIDYIATADDLAVAAQTRQLLGGLVQAGKLSGAEMQAILALGGGGLYEPVPTVEEIAEERAAMAYQDEGVERRAWLEFRMFKTRAHLDEEIGAGRPIPPEEKLVQKFAGTGEQP